MLWPARQTVRTAGGRRGVANRSRYYRQWRTFQMSDHLPLWLEVVTDYSDDYLAGS